MRTASIGGSVFPGRRFDSSKRYDANAQRTFLKCHEQSSATRLRSILGKRSGPIADIAPAKFFGTNLNKRLECLLVSVKECAYGHDDTSRPYGLIVGTLWVLTKSIQAWRRFFHALIYPPNVPKRRKDIPIGLHPHHLKRAGQ
jgi:hypothetical protein